MEASIAQSGEIPPNAKSLHLKAVLEPTSNFAVAIGGQSISVIPLLTLPSYTLLAGEISPFAGQTLELRITALSTAERPFSSVNFDSIVFSTEVVPEPRTFLLLLGGGVFWIIWRKCATRRPSPRWVCAAGERVGLD